MSIPSVWLEEPSPRGTRERGPGRHQAAGAHAGARVCVGVVEPELPQLSRLSGWEVGGVSQPPGGALRAPGGHLQLSAPPPHPPVSFSGSLISQGLFCKSWRQNDFFFNLLLFLILKLCFVFKNHEYSVVLKSSENSLSMKH